MRNEPKATILSASPAASTADRQALSTSGADLESEQQYWVAVGGTPDVCADVVAAPYLVSSADAADRDRLDDRSA